LHAPGSEMNVQERIEKKTQGGGRSVGLFEHLAGSLWSSEGEKILF